MRILRFICFLCCFWAQAGVGFAASLPPESLSAQAAIVVEARTGRVVYEKNARSRLFPASTTKMATALVALENGRTDDVVTIGEDAAGAEGSAMQIAVGDQISLLDLLYGVLMVSGNDATIAVADHMAGSVENFAALMTKRAQELGALHTNFVNSSGLPHEGHYSTAYDLSRIAMAAYENPVFREIVRTQRKEVACVGSDRRIALENTNLLLEQYPGCDGIKTGYTEAAGECLVASAERNGVHLIAIVMNVEKDRRWEEAASLLDYGFERVVSEFARDRHALMGTVRVLRGENYQITVRPKLNLSYPVLDGDAGDFSLRAQLPKVIEAPVRAGQQVGWMKILYKGREVDQVEMIADQDVQVGFSFISLLLSWYDALFEALQGFGL